MSPHLASDMKTRSASRTSHRSSLVAVTGSAGEHRHRLTNRSSIRSKAVRRIVPPSATRSAGSATNCSASDVDTRSQLILAAGATRLPPGGYRDDATYVVPRRWLADSRGDVVILSRPLLHQTVREDQHDTVTLDTGRTRTRWSRHRRVAGSSGASPLARIGEKMWFGVNILTLLSPLRIAVRDSFCGPGETRARRSKIWLEMLRVFSSRCRHSSPHASGSCRGGPRSRATCYACQRLSRRTCRFCDSTICSRHSMRRPQSGLLACLDCHRYLRLSRSNDLVRDPG